MKPFGQDKHKVFGKYCEFEPQHYCEWNCRQCKLAEYMEKSLKCRQQDTVRHVLDLEEPYRVRRLKGEPES